MATAARPRATVVLLAVLLAVLVVPVGVRAVESDAPEPTAPSTTATGTDPTDEPSTDQPSDDDCEDDQPEPDPPTTTPGPGDDCKPPADPTQEPSPTDPTGDEPRAPAPAPAPEPEPPATTEPPRPPDPTTAPSAEPTTPPDGGTGDDRSRTLDATRDRLDGILPLASLDVGFVDDVSELTQHETHVFFARIRLPRSGSPGDDTNPVRVGIRNRAVLAETCRCDVDLSPNVPIVRELEARPRGSSEGWFESSWEWEVTPREPGPLSLGVTIQPILTIDGKQVAASEDVNEPFRTTVVVHPNQAAADAAGADVASGISIDGVPETVREGRRYELVASYGADLGELDASLTLESEAADITALEASRRTDDGGVPRVGARPPCHRQHPPRLLADDQRPRR